MILNIERVIILMIITDKDIYSVDVLFDKKLYGTYENILIYDISYKASTATKPLRIRFNKIDRFIRVRGWEIRHLVLFDCGFFDNICDKVKYLIS